MSIFEINQDIEDVVALIEDQLSKPVQDDLEIEKLNRDLELLEMEAELKLSNYYKVIKDQEAKIYAFEIQKKRFDTKMKTAQAAIDWMKNTIKDVVRIAGQPNRSGNYTYKTPDVTYTNIYAHKMTILNDEKVPSTVCKKDFAIKNLDEKTAKKLVAFLKKSKIDHKETKKVDKNSLKKLLALEADNNGEVQNNYAEIKNEFSYVKISDGSK